MRGVGCGAPAEKNELKQHLNKDIREQNNKSMTFECMSISFSHGAGGGTNSAHACLEGVSAL